MHALQLLSTLGYFHELPEAATKPYSRVPTKQNLEHYSIPRDTVPELTSSYICMHA